MITILTATYNRVHTLPCLYQSLLDQTSYEFEWLVIDDGSIDNTERLIETYQEFSPFNIRYFKKENAGKCSALNKGIKLALYEWVFIMDSDDKVAFNAIEKINNMLRADIEEDIGSIFGLAKIKNKENRYFDIVGRRRYCDWVKSGKLFDTAPLVRKSIAINYPFPLFRKEKYMAESWLSNQIDKSHFSYFSNDHFMVADYQADGLSAQSLKLRMEAPRNAMTVYSSFLSSDVGFVLKIKYSINYWRFYFHANKKYIDLKIDKNFIKYILSYPFGYILFVNDSYKKSKNIL